jgi:hypothetical protein
VQAEHSNHRKLRRLRAGVVSVAVEGPLSAGQVGDEKTNVCEPLLTHRKNRTMASKPGLSGVPGMKAHPIVAVCCEPGGGLRAGLVVSGV